MKKTNAISILQKTFEIMMIAIFAFLVLGELLLPVENEVKEGACQRFEADWVRILPGGETESVTVQGGCEAQPGELVVIETILPENQEDTTFCIRSMQQELAIYVGDELRCEYSTLDKQLFGKTSTMTYVFFNIEEEDAGEMLRIEYSTCSSYTGSFSEILMGEKSEIWKHFLDMYAPATAIAGLLFLLSIVVFCYGALSKVFYKKEVEIWHLGNGIMLASTWLLVESRLRQFILPNSTVAMHMGFFVMMLIPYPLYRQLFF